MDMFISTKPLYGETREANPNLDNTMCGIPSQGPVDESREPLSLLPYHEAVSYPVHSESHQRRESQKQARMPAFCETSVE